jgi:hypothetical protein
MPFVKHQNLLKLALIPLVVFGLIFGFFCAGMFNKTQMHMAATQGQQPCCGMTVQQHIDSLHSTFLAIPNQNGNNWALIILGLILALIFTRKIYLTAAQLRKDLSIPYKLYLREHLDLPLFNHLKLAFSNGILHPKLY